MAEKTELQEHMETVAGGRLARALGLTLVILAVELAGGVWSHSLALLSDAGHVTTDVFALGLAWYAVRQSSRPADAVRTFGYHRVGILAAMANGVTLVLLVFAIVWEAAQRLAHPEPVQGGVVAVAALVGVGVNAYIALGFRSQGQNLNVRAAVLHAVGDLLASIGVILAGVVMLLTGWLYADPLVSVLIAALIGWNALNLVRETVDILLEGTPRGITLTAVKEAVAGVPGVVAVHDLHVWSISGEHTAMSAHIVVREGSAEAAERVMRSVEQQVCESFGVGHTTVQVEVATACAGDFDHLIAHNHPHAALAGLPQRRRRTPLSRRRPRELPATS